MFCTNCGTQLPEGTKFCTNCGAALVTAEQPVVSAPEPTVSAAQPSFEQPPVEPQSEQPYQQPYQQQSYQQPAYNAQPQRPLKRMAPYLTWAIIVTALCCWPFGIPAIVNAAKINKCNDTGDYAGAEDAAAKAKKWTIIAAVVGFVINILYIVLLASLISA